MDEPSAGVRRLCVAAATGPALMLMSACRGIDASRLYVTQDHSDGTGIAFALPGIDEVAIVIRIADALRHFMAAEPELPQPVLLAFHVGITRIEGEEFGGEAPIRTGALLRDRAIRTAAAAYPLAVIMTDGLYMDLRAEGLPGDVWRHVAMARAWVGCWRAEFEVGDAR